MKKELAHLPNYAMLAMHCASVVLMSGLRTNKVAWWNFLDIHSEDVDSKAFGEDAEVKHVHFLGGLSLPKGNVRVRVTVYHPHGDVWRAHEVELRTWSEVQKEGDGGCALFSAAEIQKLFAS
jgi:hypothetical protein